MEKDDWYYDRIVWKARKNYLFKNDCIEFKQLDQKLKNYLHDIIGDDVIPVLVFWASEKAWTVLSTTSILSFYENSLHLVEFSSMGNQFAPCLEKRYIKPNLITSDKLLMIINKQQDLEYMKKLEEEATIKQINSNKIKSNSKWLYVKNTKIFIYLPSAKQVFGLWNILLMISKLSFSKKA